jgi:tetratricopeptide (TPR) repeat protein
MSTNEPFSPGSMLAQYRLGERIGNTVWQADDTRTGKAVAVKLLTRQLPKDPARRDALVREVRQGAALYHTNIAGIIEVAVAGDLLLLVMELVNGQSLSKRFGGAPAERAEFFRVAYQTADALKLLHLKNVIHANVNGDALLITPSGQVKLVGLNMSNLLPKKEGPAGTYQQKGTDVRCVSYMSPEQIAGGALTPQTDIWSAGVVLYEVGTGRLPYVANSAPEIARKIVDESPASPKSGNPNIDPAVLAVMGRCLFKDPFRRQKDAKTMLEDIAKADPPSAQFAGELARAATATAAAPEADSRPAILFLADIANHAAMHPADAAKAAARMQQVLGEAAYLFDGNVVDPFGPRVIAELPTVESALEAARKGEFDFSPEQQEGEPLQVRLLLHAGDVVTRDGTVVGEAVTKGFEILSQLPPLKLFVSEEVSKRGRPANTRLRDVGARAGVKLYEIVPPEPKVEAPPEVSTAELEAEAAAEAALLAAAAKKKKQQQQLAAVAAVMIVILAAAGVMWRSRQQGETAVVTPAAVTASGPAPATAAAPRKVFVSPVTVEGTDPALAPRADAIRRAAIEVLRAFPEVRIADGAAADVTAVTSTMRAGAAGPELGLPGVPPAPAPDAASGVQSLLQYVAAQLKTPPHPATTPLAMNAFADAVSASEYPKIESALRAALKADPNFLPAQLMAMRFFNSAGKNADALAAAKQVVALDPSNVDAAHEVARASLGTGDLASAFAGYNAILKNDPHNAEALNTLGKYAIAAGDLPKFAECLKRIRPSQAAIQDADVLLVNGRIDQASDRYYDIKLKIGSNLPPPLSLKIGRISVLRRGMEVAQEELRALEKSDPKYGAHVLKAYLLAQNGNRAAAAEEMKAAQAASVPGDDFYTCTAELAALAGDPKTTVDALEKAAARKEPNEAYVLSNPLFVFLQSDARFNKLREKLNAGQSEIRTALAGVTF